jgi:hypothetical protein
MKKPTREEVECILEGSTVTPAGRELAITAFERKPLGPMPVTLPHCLSAAIASIGTQRQVYLNNALGQLAKIFLLEGYGSPARYYLTWIYEGVACRLVGSEKDGMTTHKARFRPFVLVYSKGKLTFSDVYPESHLQKEAEKENPVFQFQNGVWVSDIRREAVAYLGIEYEVRSTESLGECMLVNMAGLYRQSVVGYQVKDAAACRRTLDHLLETGFAAKEELIDSGMIVADDLNHLVATNQLYFPFAEQNYFDAPNCYVFRDRNAYGSYIGQRCALNKGFLEWGDGEKLKKGDEVVYYGHPAKIESTEDEGVDLRVGNSTLKLSASDVGMLKYEKKLLRKPLEPTFLPGATPREDQEAAFRRDVLAGYVRPIWPEWHSRAGRPVGDDTLTEWKNIEKTARAKGLDVLDALRPSFHLRGRRGPVIQETEHILVDVLGEAALNDDPSTVAKWWEKYKSRVVQAGYSLDYAIAYDNFRVRVHNASPVLYRRIRDGESACYEISHFSPYKSNVFLDGDLHCALAQADHMSVDYPLEHLLTHKPVEGKSLWLSVLVNISPIFPLAHVWTMHRPNAVTVQLLLLECVRRNGFLPPFIIVDNEGNFDSLAMHAVLRHAESSVLWRPSYEPRFGSQIESFFHVLSVRALRELAGNFLSVQEFERLSAAKRARNKDLLTLTELNVFIDAIFYEGIYNTPGLDGRTPSEYIAASEKYNGEFHLKPQRITENLRRNCMPPISRDGRRKISREGTVVGENILYRDERLINLAGKDGFVHPDRFAPGTAHVFVPDLDSRTYAENADGKWFTVQSDFARVFGCFSYNEVLCAFAEASQLRSGKRRCRTQNDGDVWSLNQAAAQMLATVLEDDQRFEKRYREAETMQALHPELRPGAISDVKGRLELVHSKQFDVSGIISNPDDSI